MACVCSSTTNNGKGKQAHSCLCYDQACLGHGPSTAPGFVGSITSNKYHYRSCTWASTSSREKGWSFTRWPRPGRKATSPVPLAGRRGATRSGRAPGTDKRYRWEAVAGVGGAPGKDARAAGPLDFPAWRAQFDVGGGGTASGLTAPGLSPEASFPISFSGNC